MEAPPAPLAPPVDDRPDDRPDDRLDVHSYARPREARVVHASLDLTLDFEARRVRGAVTLSLELGPGARELTLDTKGLVIHRVTDERGGPLAFALGPADPILGAALTIELTGPGRVVVHYETGPGAEALQWLEPRQTAGGEQPFLFTQGHAIFSRTWLPIQDSPGVRFAYDARVTAPAALTCRMSAERVDEPGTGGEDVHANVRTHSFRMREPVPAYLVALVAGRLEAREVGPRTAVLAEPELIERAAWELAELERMVTTAEGLLGPYLWGRFDVVVMPPSFPYGGMENPRLTFASPTLLAGDRSLTTVLVHELAHAWAGNLVVHATWSDFWINEGTTVYLELRLGELLWGEAHATLLLDWGHRELVGELARMGEGAPDGRLCLDLAGRDPAEGVTVVPYLKGALFYAALERVVGRERLTGWLRGWFERKAFGAVTTRELAADLREHLLEPAGLGARIELERWLYEPGLLDEATPPASSMLAEVEVAAAAALAGAAPSPPSVTGWTPQALRHFVGRLVATTRDPDVVARVDAALGLSTTNNLEVLGPWLRLLARVERDEAVPLMERFLAEQGRLKLLRPLYAELLSSSWGAPIARRSYAGARGRYHALVQASLDRLFEVHGRPA